METTKSRYARRYDREFKENAVALVESDREVKEVAWDLGVSHKPRKATQLRPIAPNWLRKMPSPDRPNQVWVGDITYIPTQEGWLYLASTYIHARPWAGSSA